MTEDELKAELRATYQRYYVEGFKRNDVSLIDRMVRYPIASINGGTVVMMDRYPVDPAALKAERGWDHSIDWSFEIPAITEHHAHAITSATRCRADGTVIERVHAFYAFTRIDGEWKMYAIGDLTY